ncbi:MAG: abortive phage infection protein [Pseudanabaena frigida]|uniref:Abortive phage infection protein n=1 Tax=Pseudanabaena frigida TaxID=945775 RepID=A0A2W4WI37_9CYAN|nr:MAG: abortive phage infection protein [Pseudanabaena frigida]
MDENAELQQFSQDLLQEVIANSDNEEDEGLFPEEIFTRIFIDHLCDAGELEDGEVCHHQSRGIKVNGYNYHEVEGRLDLFVSIFNQKTPPVTISKNDVDTAIKRLKGFLEQSCKGLYKSLEEASPAYDLAEWIYKHKKQLSNFRLFIFTDGLVTTQQFKESAVVGERIFSINVWDIRRLYRCVNSGKKREAIEIDFEERFGKAISCLRIPEASSDYDCCMLIIPGEILRNLYADYGSRLLERNVRSFLQARGKVNKGIRKTIIEEPERFLAYNNGISATAESVRFVDNGHAVASIKDLQIVNGGQTTASIYQTARKDKADLSKVYVQAKLTIVKSKRIDIDEIVPLISRYANSQNKVNEADFSANEPFHIQIEEFSRTIWASATDGSQRQTHWFYERARGQYLEAKNKETTAARKRIFEETYPKYQVFTKTDLAKFQHTFEQLPHFVSRGAQKNFAEFTAQWADKKDVTEVDIDYFKHLIAKAILFKTTEKIVQQQKFGGYRANIVTYTLAYLSASAPQYIDLDYIWKLQTLPIRLQEVIKKVSFKVYESITAPPEGKSKNVTEWCKQLDCWNKVKSLDIKL